MVVEVVGSKHWCQDRACDLSHRSTQPSRMEPWRPAFLPRPQFVNFSGFPPRPNPPHSYVPCFPGLRPPVMTSQILPEVNPRMLLCPPTAPVHTFCFSRANLELALYGYSSATSSPYRRRHAISGLRVGEIGQGWRGSRSDPPAHDLPEELTIAQTSLSGLIHFGVFNRSDVIRRGVKYGPFKGKVVNTSEIKTFDDNSYMWEVFVDGRLSHFIDGRGASGNWMSYVNCARSPREQNLVVVQEGEQLFYEVLHDIPPGGELLVWYGSQYLQFMGIPVTVRTTTTHGAGDRGERENSEGYHCERCGKVFAYRYYRDKHLKYTRCVDQGDRKFPCHLCARSFEKRDRLRIHVLHVHEKHRPHKCAVCNKSFSQSSSLNKHMRVHSGERPYKCVYCSKSFTASSILRTHIRQHSGERPFKCKFCGKAFASHAAHDSHVRRTHAREKPLTCKLCFKDFAHQLDMNVHLRSSHTESASPSNTSWTEATPESAAAPSVRSSTNHQ